MIQGFNLQEDERYKLAIKQAMDSSGPALHLAKDEMIENLRDSLEQTSPEELQSIQGGIRTLRQFFEKLKATSQEMRDATTGT